MAYYRKDLTECTKHHLMLCEKEKRIINKIKAEYLERTGAVLSISRAIKILIRRNK